VFGALPTSTAKFMINFSTQFRQCKKYGYTGKGKFQAFKDHPEMMPNPISRNGRKVLAAIQSGKLTGLETIACLRFGGECRSDNPGCRKLRGFND
jgi:hypothetical protein